MLEEEKLPKATFTSTSLHPRNRRSPRHEAWRQNIAAGVKRASQQRKKAGLLSVNDLVKESGGLPRGIITSFLDSGALPSSKVGSRRYVHRSAWKRFRKTLAQGGANAAA